MISRFFCMIVLLCLVSCAHTPPRQIDNLCLIFAEKPRWKKSALKSQKKWSASVAITMAIMYQESAFRHNARPPMRYFLGVLPIGRASNAYGYAQALTGTWGDYRQAIGSGGKKRHKFADAFDFIQWYLVQSQRINKVKTEDAYAHYLNYHEGHTGYAKKSYLQKSWLKKVAQRVAQRATRYQKQLAQCR